MTESITLTEKSAADLVELMSYRLTKMYLPIFNNSQTRKEVNLSLLDCFKMHEATLNGVSYVSIIDMGFIWRLATPSKAISNGEIMQQRYSTFFNAIPIP